MHRVGADPGRRRGPGRRGRPATPRWRLEGFWTHLAVADELDNPYTAEQLARFDAALAAWPAPGSARRSATPPTPAGAMWHPASRYDLVRCGIALYGLAPGRRRSGP